MNYNDDFSEDSKWWFLIIVPIALWLGLVLLVVMFFAGIIDGYHWVRSKICQTANI